MTRPTMHPTIRRVSTPEEWDAAETLLDEYVRGCRTTSRVDPFGTQPGLEAELADPTRSYGGHCGGLFVAWSREIAQGIVGLACHQDGSAELKRLFVRPPHRRHGIADRLVHHMIGRAALSGCGRIWLESIPDEMDPAIRVCARNGFEPQCDRDASNARDVVVMERPLPLRRRRPTPTAFGYDGPVRLVSQRSSRRPVR